MKFLLDRKINIIILDYILNLIPNIKTLPFIKGLLYPTIPVCKSKLVDLSYPEGLLDAILEEKDNLDLVKYYMEKIINPEIKEDKKVFEFKQNLSVRIRELEQSFNRKEYEKLVFNLHRLKTQCEKFGFINYANGLETLKLKIKENNINEFSHTLKVLKEVSDLFIMSLEEHFKV
jgi:hypothetical protein